MSDITSLADLSQKFRSLAARLNLAAVSFHTAPQNDGSAHIEIANGQFQFVVTERGSESQRIKNLSADDVLYLLFEGITQGMATTYELDNRIPDTDGRCVWFPYQERLLESLNPSWGAKLKEKHHRLLIDHPLRT